MCNMSKTQHELIHPRTSNNNQAITCKPTTPFQNIPNEQYDKLQNPASASLHELFKAKPLERLVAELHFAVLSLILISLDIDLKN